MRSALATLVCLLLTVSVHAAVIEVEGPQDSLDGPPLINHCTLRKAIINANTDSAIYPQCAAGSGIDTIVFLSPMTISLTRAGVNEEDALTGDLDITQSVIIEGGGTTIDGANLDRIFHINPHDTPGITVTLNNLHLRNGRGLGSAGAIQVLNATLHMNGVTISGCYSFEGDGGAMYVDGGASVTTMTNCTISGNHSAFHAGAAWLSGTTTITSSTIAGNSSDAGLCGGLVNAGTTTLRNSIIAENTNISPLDYNPNLSGTFISTGYNVIGDLGNAPGDPTIPPTTGDQFGVTNAQVNVGPLQDNGGPTPTRELLAGSVAIDKGHSSGSSTDQRGLTRPCDLASVSNATGGDGADVGAFEVQGACAGTNHDPVAVDDAASVAEDSGANPIDVLVNDSDSDGDTLIITAVTQGAHGSVVNNGTNVTYAPAPNFNGSDSFTYTIDDGHGGAPATATVSVTVTPVNDPPVAAPNSYTINQDTTLTVAAPGVLANDSDIDGDTLHAVLVTSPAHGTPSPLAADGSISYTPNPGFAGTDSFTYKANDGHADSNIVTVTIHVLDTQPPDIDASVTTSLLWPPNHSLINVGFALSVTDNGGGAVTTSIEVRSDEDDVTAADGDQSPDAKDIAPVTLRLRAERDATQNGRVYVIRVTSTDASSNTATRCVTVVVPKSMSAADVADVNAQAAAAQATCSAPFVVGDGPVIGPKQ